MAAAPRGTAGERQVGDDEVGPGDYFGFLRAGADGKPGGLQRTASAASRTAGSRSMT